MLQTLLYAIRRSLGCGAKANPSTHSVHRQDFQFFRCSFTVPVKYNFRRILDGVGQMSAVGAGHRNVDLRASSHMVRTDPLQVPVPSLRTLIAGFAYRNARQLALVLAAEGVEKWDPFFRRDLDVGTSRMDKPVMTCHFAPPASRLHNN